MPLVGTLRVVGIGQPRVVVGEAEGEHRRDHRDQRNPAKHGAPAHFAQLPRTLPDRVRQADGDDRDHGIEAIEARHQWEHDTQRPRRHRLVAQQQRETDRQQAQRREPRLEAGSGNAREPRGQHQRPECGHEPQPSQPERPGLSSEPQTERTDRDQIAGNAHRSRDREGISPDGERGGREEQPERVAVALHTIAAGLEDEPVPGDPVLRVAIGDVGVVEGDGLL